MARSWRPYNRGLQLEKEIWNFNGKEVNVRPTKIRMAQAVFRNQDGTLEIPDRMKRTLDVKFDPEVLAVRRERHLQLMRELNEKNRDKILAKRKEYNRIGRMRKLLKSIEDPTASEKLIERRKQRLREKYPHLLDN